MAAGKHALLALLLWLTGATAALAASVLFWTVASDGKLNAIALVPFVWTVALFAGAVRAVPAALPVVPWRTAMAWQLALQRAGSDLLALLQQAVHHLPHEARRRGQEKARPDRSGDGGRQMVLQLNRNTRAPRGNWHLVGAAMQAIFAGWAARQIGRHALPQQPAG